MCVHFTVGLCRLEQQFCLRFFVIYVAHEFKSNHRPPTIKLAFHDADTDILARIVAIMSACRSACYRKLPEIARVGRVGEDVRVGVGVGAGVVEFQLETGCETYTNAVTYLTKHEMSEVHFLMTRADLFSSSWARDMVKPSSM